MRESKKSSRPARRLEDYVVVVPAFRKGKRYTENKRKSSHQKETEPIKKESDADFNNIM